MKKKYMRMSLVVKTQVDFSHEYLIDLEDWNGYSEAVRRHIEMQQQTIAIDAYAKMMRTEVEPTYEIIEEEPEDEVEGPAEIH